MMEPGSAVLDLSGHIADRATAKDAEVAVIWMTNAGAYKTGDARASDGAFELFQMKPPDGALIDGLGVGYLVMLAPGKSLPDGLVTEGSALGDVRSPVMSKQAVIYRATTTTNPLRSSTWPNLFPVGLSCAKCVPKTKALFDGWEPAPCEPFELTTLTRDQQCNWD